MKIAVREIELHEADGLLWARVRIEPARGGAGATGAAAERLDARWLAPESEEHEVREQLLASVRLARDTYLAGEPGTAFAHSIENYGPQIALGALQGLSSLAACAGPALLDRAILDALCRALGLSLGEALAKNAPGLQPPGWQADLGNIDLDEFLLDLAPASVVAARFEASDGAALERAAATGCRAFRVPLSGHGDEDLERLGEIAAALARAAPEASLSLDGRERYGTAAEFLELLKDARRDARIKPLLRAVAFIERPIRRDRALDEDVSELAEEKPLVLDLADDSLQAFPRARRLGYAGVTARGCKGPYKAILNRARCTLWNREERADRYFLAADLCGLPAGAARDQDLALARALGIREAAADDAGALEHGHHRPPPGGPGFAGGPEPDWGAMQRIE